MLENGSGLVLQGMERKGRTCFRFGLELDGQLNLVSMAGLFLQFICISSFFLLDSSPYHLQQILMDRKQNTLCKLHTLRAIQIGSCITCKSSSPICETKGCIKHHLQSQKMHTSYTVKDIQKIADDYINSNEEKRKILGSMIREYFQSLKAEIESLYHQIDQAVSNLRFENFLLNQEERKFAQHLVTKRYSQLLCEDVARVIPKMLKCASFEQKQFNHLKDFLASERECLSKTVNSMILNLPYFRDDQNIVSIEKFSEISDQLLSNVNKKIEELVFRPKKLRIKYSEDEVRPPPLRESSTSVSLALLRIKVHKTALKQRELEINRNPRVLLHLEHTVRGLPDRILRRDLQPSLPHAFHHIHRLQGHFNRVHRVNGGEQEHRVQDRPQGLALLIIHASQYHYITINNQMNCEFCHVNEMTPLLTRCCKAFICLACKERLEKKLTCQCGRAGQPGKKCAIESPELFQVIKRYKQGKRKQCDRCDDKAEIQCTQCDMVFCTSCNNQLHAAVGFMKHQRKKLSLEPNAQKIKKKDATCSSHRQLIILGCDCGIGLCTLCLKSHKDQCPKGAKTKPLKQFKQQYYLNVLFKMRQVEQFKQRLRNDKEKYANHFQAQQAMFSEQKKLICEQFQYLAKLIEMKYSETKTRLTNYWKDCQKVYAANIGKIGQQIGKYDEYAQQLNMFTDHLLNLDYFDKKIARTNVNFQFVNIKTLGVEQVQAAILNVIMLEKNWESNQTDFFIDPQQTKPNLKEEFRFIGNMQSVSEQIVDCTNFPLKDRVLNLLPSHCQLFFSFIHLPYQNLKYQLEYGVGMKMKGQEIFKKVMNSNGYGTIEGLNPNTKYRIRMRVADGQWGAISEITTLDVPRFNLENSLCAKAVAENAIHLVKGGAIYGSNQINFGIHKWVIKMTSKSISYQDSETACMSLGVSNKQAKKAVFVGTTLNYGFWKSQIILKVILDCYEKRLVIINSTTNKEEVYQNLPNFPLFPTIQNKGSGQILVKYNLSTDDPNFC